MVPLSTISSSMASSVRMQRSRTNMLSPTLCRMSRKKDGHYKEQRREEDGRGGRTGGSKGIHCSRPIQYNCKVEIIQHHLKAPSLSAPPPSPLPLSHPAWVVLYKHKSNELCHLVADKGFVRWSLNEGWAEPGEEEIPHSKHIIITARRVPAHTHTDGQTTTGAQHT